MTKLAECSTCCLIYGNACPVKLKQDGKGGRGGNGLLVWQTIAPCQIPPFLSSLSQSFSTAQDYVMINPHWQTSWPPSLQTCVSWPTTTNIWFRLFSMNEWKQYGSSTDMYIKNDLKGVWHEIFYFRFFFINQCPLQGLWVSHWDRFKFFQRYAEIIANECLSGMLPTPAKKDINFEINFF
jgi:hypothetical protein